MYNIYIYTRVVQTSSANKTQRQTIIEQIRTECTQLTPVLAYTRRAGDKTISTLTRTKIILLPLSARWFSLEGKEWVLFFFFYFFFRSDVVASCDVARGRRTHTYYYNIIYTARRVIFSVYGRKISTVPETRRSPQKWLVWSQRNNNKTNNINESSASDTRLAM